MSMSSRFKSLQNTASQLFSSAQVQAQKLIAISKKAATIVKADLKIAKDKTSQFLSSTIDQGKRLLAFTNRSLKKAFKQVKAFLSYMKEKIKKLATNLKSAYRNLKAALKEATGNVSKDFTAAEKAYQDQKVNDAAAVVTKLEKELADAKKLLTEAKRSLATAKETLNGPSYARQALNIIKTMLGLRKAAPKKKRKVAKENVVPVPVVQQNAAIVIEEAQAPAQIAMPALEIPINTEVPPMPAFVPAPAPAPALELAAASLPALENVQSVLDAHEVPVAPEAPEAPQAPERPLFSANPNPIVVSRKRKGAASAMEAQASSKRADKKDDDTEMQVAPPVQEPKPRVNFQLSNVMSRLQSRPSVQHKIHNRMAAFEASGFEHKPAPQSSSAKWRK